MSSSNINNKDLNILESIRHLEKNWAGEGAEPITDIAVDNAYKFLECYYNTLVNFFHDSPHIFPTVDSGVIIEFDENDINTEINVEIHKDGSYSYAIYEKEEFDIIEEKTNVDNIHEIIHSLFKFFERGY